MNLRCTVLGQWLEQWFSNVVDIRITERARVLTEQNVSTPLAQVLFQLALGGAREYTFLNSFQMMLGLLVQGPHLENHCLRA